MSNFRAVLTFAVIGTLLGIIAATLSSPSILSTELCGFGANVKLSSSCLDTVGAATGGLVRYQLYGALAGTVLGIIAGIFFSVRRGKKAAAAAPALPPKV